MMADLKHFVHDQLETTRIRANRAKTDRLTVGVEQEFFLFDALGTRPATHEQSQGFLGALAEEDGWRVYELRDSPDFGRYIDRVCLDLPGGRWTAVKYDHHPHLLEVAFAYENNLHSLYRNIREFHQLAAEVAQRLDLTVSYRGNLPEKQAGTAVESQLSEFIKLRHYRAQLIKRRGETPDPVAVNYAAYIAATQTHIGGTNWWLKDQLIQDLYRFEPYLLGYGFRADGRAEEVRKRWKGYHAVFRGVPLVGFPQLETWNIDQWTDALKRSPLAAGSESEWAGQSLKELDATPFATWPEFFKSVRDLQVIRPRLFGTIEFRSDPSQADPEAVLRVAAIRLGLTEAVRLGIASPSLSFEQAQDLWWRIALGTVEPLDPQPVLTAARHGLLARGLGEEAFLQPRAQGSLPDRRRSTN